MTKDEIDSQIERMRGLWPKWDCNDRQAGECSYALKWYDYEVLKNAISVCYRKSRLTYPILDKIVNECRKNQKRTVVERRPPKEPAVFIQCVAKFEGHGPLGRFEPIEYRIYPFANYSPDKVLEVAQRAAKEHAQTYGGEWEVVQQADHVQMTGRSRKLQIEALREEE